MATFFDALTDAHIDFIRQQHMFFTATAPPLETGRINLSPKGTDSLRVLDHHRIAYTDLTGSGNETAAHLQHDPQHRITMMFCSFGEKPLILRLYGQGSAVRESDPRWNELQRLMPAIPGMRQFIVMNITSVQTSCGFGVPKYAFESHRATLTEWADQKGDAAVRDYRRQKNTRSIDGLQISGVS